MGVNLNLTVLCCTTRYDKPDYFLGRLRKGKQHIYIANLGMLCFALGGVQIYGQPQ